MPKEFGIGKINRVKFWGQKGVSGVAGVSRHLPLRLTVPTPGEQNRPSVLQPHTAYRPLSPYKQKGTPQSSAKQRGVAG